MKRKPLTHGQRANFYLKKDLPEELLDWINVQSDLTLFVLHAIEELYKKTGYVDIGSILPRNHEFELSGSPEYLNTQTPEKEPESNDNAVLIDEGTEPEQWHSLDEYDDMYS